jgi:hypothetical protein
MKTHRLVVAGLLVPVLALAADRLNVKTGLWEVTVVAQMSGMPPLPPEVLAKIPEEQRAQLAGVLGQEPKTHKSRECVTEKDLDQPFQAEEIKHCSTTLTKSSPTVQEYAVICTGEHPSRGKMHVEAPTPTTMTGYFDMTVDNKDAGAPMRINTKLSGHWLAAACSKADTGKVE